VRHDGPDVLLIHERGDPGPGAVADRLVCAGHARGIRVRVRWATPGQTPQAPVPDVAVILAGCIPPDRRPDAERQARALDERGVPIVRLVDRGVWDGAGSLGEITLPLGICPDSMLLAICALVQRDRTVASLQAELSRSDRTGVGAAAEMGRWYQEMQSAAALQRGLLPDRLPGGDGYELGVLFRPAGMLSGDIYEARMLDDRRLWFMLADAVGHGVPAALLTILIAQSVSSCVQNGKSPIEPSVVLDSLNRTLLTCQSPSGSFATAICGVYDVQQAVCTIACAGHPPPLVVANGSSRFVDVSGPLLGVFEDTDFESTRVPLLPGETLVVYSDGFETAFPGIEASATRARSQTARLTDPGCPGAHLAPLVRSLDASAGGLDAGLEALTRELDRQAGSLHQRDDLTVLSIRRPLASGGRSAVA